MQDRAKLNNGKSSKIMCPSDYASLTWEQFRALFVAGTAYIDITANNSLDNNAGVSVVGTALNKANILSDATASKFGFDAQDNPTVNDVFGIVGNTINKVVSISLPTASWTGSASPFSQVITVTGSTANSKIDLQPDATTIARLVDDGCVGLYVENNNNVLTAYAVGDKPTVNLTIQATIYEVSA